MPIKTAPRVYEPADLFQQDAKRVLQGLSRVALLQGVLLEDIAIATTSTKVTHTLGRKPRGWFVVDRTADSRVYRDPTKTTELSTYLHLKASTATTVSLWVF